MVKSEERSPSSGERTLWSDNLKDYEMRKLLLFVCIIALACLSGCATKLPVPQNENMGVAVIPLKIRNDCVYSSKLAYRYNFVGIQKMIGDRQDDRDIPAIEIPLEPHLGQKYLVTQELEPGTYVLDRILVMFYHPDAVSSSNKDYYIMPSSIAFTIEEGKLSIANKVFTVHQYEVGGSSFASVWNVKPFGNSGKMELLKILKTTENANLWSIIE